MMINGIVVDQDAIGGLKSWNRFQSKTEFRAKLCMLQEIIQKGFISCLLFQLRDVRVDT